MNALTTAKSYLEALDIHDITRIDQTGVRRPGLCDPGGADEQKEFMPFMIRLFDGFPNLNFNHNHLRETVRDGQIVRIASAYIPSGGVLGLLQQIGVKLLLVWLMKLVIKASKILG
ncbi:MAG: hypothetical protein L0332_22545 [Chloroflexi bacterium]|nr:hypothetical protein [Chloroflexota bacterium]MCI0577970.1 hypothetical protein [Chloroflexota bacterium]MCI0649280.1 hypothetical protein [Chloroflexota bacterium]MCI0729473.1 hypothetical protein [Chloroflexota bacterium]